ncbi:hypothetical protein QYE76_024801 [Lolium multiflorum]|uniref:Uncharacterized protein n=1 Tax=Lolium multiflorum TaxID=4521 RepID=A0AAD8RFJ6_LOLMU|nr:hypothetical protein QYE76_024801 [Lolium multiflorum]
MLFREEHANTNYCIHCKCSRNFEVDTNGDGQKRQTTVAKNILRYLPVLPRIQRLFMTEDTAQQMRWAVEGIRPDSGKMIHPSDGTAWKNFVKKYPLKAGDPRSVAIAISTDGFNPYGRRIRKGSSGQGSSSSPTSDGLTGGEPRGSAALLAFPRGSAGGEARLSTMLELLVAVARRGEASIGGDDLRAPATPIVKLGRLRRQLSEWLGRVEAVMGGEGGAVKDSCSGRLYL